MKLQQCGQRGFTLGELLVSLGVVSLLFAALFTAIAALNRSFTATDDYFSTHMQQIRIMDYLARDVKRSFSVTTSPDLKTVTCIMPNYTVATGDPEAVTDASTIGIRRTPVVVGPINKSVVDYGTRGTRTVTDGMTTIGSSSFISATGAFTTIDVGNPITGTNIQSGTTITGYVSATTVLLSKPATGTSTLSSPITFTVYGDGNRTLSDATTTAGSTTITSSTAYFTGADIGKPVVGTTLSAGTTITACPSATTATLSAVANGTAAKQTVTIGGTVVVYAVSGNAITRTENGVITTIASSTDSLLPLTTDWQLSNTEYTTTTVTFQPIFTISGNSAQRSGTTVFATAYLRNKRRGN